uniref:protein-serine/threonine phosphatase n=1 Tax=Phallusia mammillata TaxID=59560 RepID=A0A6F9DGP6_9ASCI|nr:uncharacterized protein LOC100180990 [Phallusia mammillata]
MALVTVQRSPSVSESDSSSITDELEDDEKAEKGDVVPCIDSPAKSKRLVRQGSVSENFFAVKGAALILPRQTSLATDNLQIVKKFGGELQIHLRAIFHHLRPHDNIKLAVRLESWKENHRRYLVIISNPGRQDTDESIIVGCDFATRESTTCTIGLVLPIWCDTSIRLDGDGGFKVICHERKHIFKPVSVQAMWSALQTLHRAVDVAQRHNYFEGSLYLTWTGFYHSRITSERLYINEWEYNEDLWAARPNYFAEKDPERAPVETLIRSKLKQVMMTMDLDNCTCREIRRALEKAIDMDLSNYKEYIDTEMLTILGQMDCSSKILDYLYLGSEWNASNFDELEELGITHILNVTLEVDNFFPDDFTYKNIRLYDIEESDLLPHWNITWKFVNEARRAGGKCLVHCKMGISRSGATVAAYLMKEKQWTKTAALQFVQKCRSIVNPNPSFLKQLDEYEGILAASSQRHNKLFRSRSESSLSEPSIADDHPVAVVSPRCGAPIIQITDENQDNLLEDSHDFDLNRRLLDIASLATPKVSRPKSWSPDEGRRPYNANQNSFEHGHLPMDTPTDSFRNGIGLPSSEPGELLLPSGTDLDRMQMAEEKRKSFTSKRRQMRRKPQDPDDLAVSEDSVFVHVGETQPPPSRQIRTKKEKKKTRSSSPAALMCEPMKRPGDLDVSIAEEQHPSMVSPMNSPSYKNAKGVDFDLLKSRFTGEKPAEPESADDVAPESPTLKAPVPVRAIVAVIESPCDDTVPIMQVDEDSQKPVFVKGHHKTASLPPTSMDIDVPKAVDPPNTDESLMGPRSRSFSETQAFSVRKIVTAIESRQDPSTGEIRVRPEGEGIQRTMSMPSSRRHQTSPLTPSGSSCAFVPVAEVPMETDDAENAAKGDSQFYIGDRQASPKPNPNSNNNNNSPASEMAPESFVISPPFSLTSSPAKPIAPKLDMTKAEEGEEAIRRSGPLSPEILQVIREVGMQLMSDSDESSRSSSFSTPNQPEPIASYEPSRTPTQPAKRRGLVRQMAREIEKRVRKLTGRKSDSKSHQASDSPNTDSSINNSNFEKRQSTPTTVINKLLMGSLSPSKERGDGDVFDSGCDVTDDHDVRVRDLVGKFSSPATSSKKTPHDVITPVTSSPRTGSKDLAALVSATPYRAPRTCRDVSGSPPSSTSSRSGRVRRTQSERSGGSIFRSTYRSIWGPHRRLSATTSQPELTDPEQTDSPRPVRELIREIETNKSSAAVHRSSSLPTSTPRRAFVRSSAARCKLTRSKSTPLLDFVKSARSRLSHS